jgi:glycosyltransferase involved in cell wall biosynthesis
MKLKPVRVLFVSGGTLDYGGISSWMLSYASEFNRDLVAVDFLVHGMESGAREQDALKLGAKVWHVPYRGQDPIGNRKGMRQAIASGYDILHAHMDGMNAYPLEIAKQNGVPIRFSHSHNTDFLTQNPIRRAIHEAARRRIPASATHLFACSDSAGRFLYGDARFDAGQVTLVKNAIDAAKFQFDVTARERLRDELGIQDQFLVGHIGRFDLRQKNQLFLLESFAKVKQKRPDLMLALVGDGSDRAQIESKVIELNLTNNVILLGYREDVNALYSAFDCFALPSLFEGLGIVLIEAQASGLECLASEAVPRETQLGNCRYLPLEIDTWADALVLAGKKNDRDFPAQEIAAQGYDIHAAAQALQQFYLEAVKLA